LVVADEGHRYAARTYKRALDYFNAKVLGVTATPDRGDGKALGIVFDETAFVFDIMDGIDAGYLVPLQYQSVRIDSIDISGVKSSGGDLSEAGLDDAILKGTEGIVQESLRLGGTRQAIAFWPGTRSAKFACDRYNAIIPGVARYIDANTPQRERRDTVARFKAGEFRILCNVGIATEGFDAPATSCIILGRPTKSRQLATQMVGRGTRVLPGTVDSFQRATEAKKRRDAIAKSDKPDCLVLDFVGNAGRHQLVTPVDILGGKYTTPELELARKEVLELQSEDRPADVAQSLKLAREALARVAEQISSRVESTITSVDPFSILHLKQTSKYTERFGHKPASSAQKESLRKAGLPETHLAAMKASDAAQILNAMAVRRSKGLASYRQLRMLRKHGFSDINITYASASRAIDYIASTGYGERAKVEREKIVEAIKGNVVI
jgi:type I site-specific restriction endonuclease